MVIKFGTTFMTGRDIPMYGRTVKVLVLLFMLVAIHVQPASAAGQTKVKVTLIGADLVENNHVGNEWRWAGYVNGKELQEGSSTTLSVSSSGTIKLTVKAEEQDKIPEEGEKAATLKVSSLKSSQTKALNVTVVENRGRYSGNTATWKFTFKIEVIK